MTDPLIWQLLLQAVLIALNAFFACAEIAVISISEARLSVLSRSGDRRALRLGRLTGQPERFLAAIQVAITLSGFLGSAFAADNFSERIVSALVNAGTTIPASTLDAVCVILITLALSYFTLVFGELVPKRLAMKSPEKIALGMSGTLSFVLALFRPIVWLLSVSTNGVLRLLGIDPNAGDKSVTEDEIRMMIDIGEEKGSIDAEEKRMLQNVFEFDDVSAGEIATHRTQLDVLWIDSDPEEWDETIHNTRHSFYPVCGESADDVIGLLDAKSYFRLGSHDRIAVMREAVDDPYFVPASVKADVLFSDMKKTRRHFVFVLDEYGGLEGVVTMNDLIEEIFGELPSRGEIDPNILEPLENGAWRMSGSVPLDAVSDALHVELPAGEFDTLGGLALSTQRSVPSDGAQFSCTVCGLDIDVRRIYDHRIEEAIVRVSASGD